MTLTRRYLKALGYNPWLKAYNRMESEAYNGMLDAICKNIPMKNAAYILVSKAGPHPALPGQPCKSHLKESNFDYFDGNTNFGKEEEGITVRFTCNVCGQVIIFHRNTQKTLL